MKVNKKWEKPSLGSCPLCKTGKIMAGQKSWYCSQYKNGCAFTVWKIISSARLTDSDFQQLIAGKTTRVKKMKSKAGKEFSAKLKLSKDAKIEFVFSDKR